MVKQPREKDSPPAGLRGRRAVQAEETRAEILRAARRHFAEKGYAATSVKEVAADAGVSVQTVYDSVGSKAELVRRLNDLIDVEANVGELARLVGTETDPAEVAAIPARITRRIAERCGDIVRASFEAARSEPDLAPVAAEGTRRHLAGSNGVAARLAALDALTPGLEPANAATTIAALADARLAIVLLDDHGLDFDAVEEWIRTTTARAVLRAP